MKAEKNIMHITESEYEGYKEGKGVITSEYTSDDTMIRKSFMWNRTLRLNKRLYIEGFNLVIE